MEPFHPHKRTHARRARHVARGFTVIEMIIVTAIIAVIATVVIVSRSSFESTTLLSSTAYDVALTVRSMQNYGISSRIQTTAGALRAGYGAHFDSSVKDKFILFADKDAPSDSPAKCHPSRDKGAPDAKYGDCAYDEDKDAEIQTYEFGNGVSIKKICAKRGDGVYCSSSISKHLDTFDIVFTRPNADAFMSINGAYHPARVVESACIELTSSRGGSRFIEFNKSGLIRSTADTCMPTVTP